MEFYGELQELSDPKTFARYLAPLHDSEWVVYAKAPFGGPERVLNYLGRYTRVAISNNRLEELKDGQVRFAYKDYEHEQRYKVMTVSADEFLRRFLLHVLPDFPVAELRTLQGIVPAQLLPPFPVVTFRWRDGRRHRQPFAAPGQIRGAVAVAETAVVADALKRYGAHRILPVGGHVRRCVSS